MASKCETCTHKVSVVTGDTDKVYNFFCNVIPDIKKVNHVSFKYPDVVECSKFVSDGRSASPITILET
jgi:hypothetical protein